jgi:hypothetical protein
VHGHVDTRGSGRSDNYSGRAICDEYSHLTIHYMTLYRYSLLIPIRAFPTEGRTTWVRRY